jgi:hypothetical protein
MQSLRSGTKQVPTYCCPPPNVATLAQMSGRLDVANFGEKVVAAKQDDALK